MRVNAEDRFLNLVMPEPNTGCWIWTGALFTNGYGVFRHEGHNLKAHRFSYYLHKGTIPPGMIVCHKCDNRYCVNPAHLFVGTQQDNVDDMISKGRKHLPKGELHGSSRLKSSDVVSIRRLASTEKHTSIALRYAISRQYVSEIVNHKKWRHIT